MSIELQCTLCGKTLRLNPKLAGKRIKCPQCATVLTVPPPGLAPPPSPPTVSEPHVSEPRVSKPTTAAPAAAPDPGPGEAKPAAKGSAKPAATPSAPPQRAVASASSDSTSAVPAAADDDGPLWHVKTDDDQYFGPLSQAELDVWSRNGRLHRDCQLLPDGADQWQWADEIYPHLAETPTEVNREAAGSAVVEQAEASRAEAASDSDLPAGSAQASRADEEDDTQWSDRSRLTAGLLGLFLGPLGLHRIYLGYVPLGLIMLATGGGCGVWSLIDALLVLTGKIRDVHGRPLR